MIEDDIISRILAREGSEFTNNPADHGGATKYGVTQRAWDDYVSRDPANAPCRDVSVLTEPWAREFYRFTAIRPFRGLISDQLLELMADSAVQHGLVRATRWLQAAAGVTVDGIPGPDTMRAANASATKCYREVLKARIKFYAECALAPGQITFLRGWINRVVEFI